MLELNDSLLSSSRPQKTSGITLITKTRKSVAKPVRRSLLAPAAGRASHCAQVGPCVPPSHPQALSLMFALMAARGAWRRLMSAGCWLPDTCSLERGGSSAEKHHKQPPCHQTGPGPPPKLPDSPLGEGQTLHTLARQGSAIY